MRSILTSGVWKELTKDLNLSPQMKRIAFHILLGLDDKKIAKELGIAVATVRAHLGRLYSALQVDDRSGVMIFFLCRLRGTVNARQEFPDLSSEAVGASPKRSRQVK